MSIFGILMLFLILLLATMQLDVGGVCRLSCLVVPCLALGFETHGMQEQEQAALRALRCVMLGGDERWMGAMERNKAKRTELN